MKILLIYIVLLIITSHGKAADELDSYPLAQISQDTALLKQFNEIKQQRGHGFITVGPGISCDTATIQNALNAQVDEIRVTTNQTYFENIVINDQSVELRGGFADCDAANNNIQTTALTQVDGGANDSVIKIQGDSQENTVVLENLDIRNGANNFGAGILVSQNPAYYGSIFIYESIIQLNISSRSGAGISFSSSADDIDLVIINSQVSNNFASSGVGGGLSCFGGRASVTLVGDTEFKFNRAEIGDVFPNGQGAGLAVSSGCGVGLYASSKINNNAVERNGGGVYVSGGGSLFIVGQQICDGDTCFGQNSDPVEIRSNLAGAPLLENDGGGMFIDGTGADNSTVLVYGGLHLGDNRARFGAGIYADNNASLNISNKLSDCWNLTRCNLFKNNRTRTVNGTGGAIYSNDSTISINHANFEDNRADVGTAIYTRGSDTLTTIQNSIFSHNGNEGADGFNDLYVLRAFLGARIDVSYSTFADNHADTLFGISNDTNELNLSSSIVHDPSSGDILVTDNGSIQINCVMAHEVSSIAGNNLSLNNPNFVDRANRDYHLSPGSPAIDYCNELGLSTFPLVDIDSEQRGYDDPNVVNNFANSFFDIGADEVSDVIFKHGFE